MKRFQVTIRSSGASFFVDAGESVLTAALRQGVMLPYSCKNGTCGSCKGRIETGEVHYPFHPPLALERPDIAEGYALMCQAEPVEDLVIEVREIEAVRDIPVRMMPVRVAEKSLLANNIMRLRLRLPKSQRLQFLAGQYVDILLPGGKHRAFSIASPPQMEDELELHIRHVEGGDFTGWVFDELKEKDILRLEGPLGNFSAHCHKTVVRRWPGPGRVPVQTPFRDGSTHVVFEPLDFIARLAALVPRQRLNLARFHGVFAPNFKHWARIVPRRARGRVDAYKPPAPMSWAQRLKWVFAIDIETCPRFGDRLRFVVWKSPLLAVLRTRLPCDSPPKEFCYVLNCGVSAPGADMGG